MELNWSLIKTFLFRTLVVICFMFLLDFLLGPFIQLARTSSTEGFYQEIKSLFKMNRVLFNGFFSLFLAAGSIVFEKKQQRKRPKKR
jgi:hypothetical protein